MATRSEEKLINELTSLISDISHVNREHREQVDKTISSLSAKIDNKHLPVHLELDILKTLQQSLAKSIESTLNGYNSPLSKLIAEVVDSHRVELKAIVESAFTETIKTDNFKQSILSAFAHKVGRLLISNNDSLMDNVANDLKKDTEFQAKARLAVHNVVKEFLGIRGI